MDIQLKMTTYHKEIHFSVEFIGHRTVTCGPSKGQRVFLQTLGRSHVELNELVED